MIENPEQQFWLKASLVEAYLGSSQPSEANVLKNTITQPAPGRWIPEKWMLETMEEQLKKLSSLLQATGILYPFN